jgi:hypothetical protein
MTLDSQARPQETLIRRFRIYDSVVNSRETAIQYAASLAALYGRPVEVQGENVAGEVVMTSRAVPAARPVDIAQTAAGNPLPEPIGRETREQQLQPQRTSELLGINNEGDTPDDPSQFSPSTPENQLQVYQGNEPRITSPVIPSVEAILLTIENRVIGQFLQNLPPVFRSLLPVGVIAGIVRRQPISLNVLLGLVTGTLLGSVANQVLRSATSGIRIISGLTGALGAIAIDRVIGSVGAANIPANIPVNTNNNRLENQVSSPENQQEIQRLINNLRRAEANQEAVAQRLRLTGQGTFEERNQAMLDAAISSRRAREELNSAIARNNQNQRLQLNNRVQRQVAGVSIQSPTFPQTLSNIGNNVAQLASSAFVISNVVNNVSTLLTGRQALGSIPANIRNIGLTTTIALRTAGNALSIPTRILGVATNIAANPIEAIIGGTVATRIPIRSTNLSLPNLPVLSGLTQRISPELADTLIPRQQIVQTLPANLRNQVPAIPTRERNIVQIRRDAAPERVPDVPRPTTAERNPLLTASDITGDIDYSIRISNNYTLAQVSRNAHFPHRIVPQLGLTQAQIIENLSRVAVNILEPIRSQYPGFIITSGFRQGQNRSDHNRGQAVDIQWNGRSADNHLEIARWITENLQYKQLIFEHSPRGSIWLHVAFETGGNRRQNLTMINNRYSPGLINHYGQRRV